MSRTYHGIGGELLEVAHGFRDLEVGFDLALHDELQHGGSVRTSRRGNHGGDVVPKRLTERKCDLQKVAHGAVAPVGHAGLLDDVHQLS